MAKAAKTAIKKDPKAAAEAKNYSKVIKAVRSPNTQKIKSERKTTEKQETKKIAYRHNA